MEFHLVVLHSAERSEARQWIVARQVSCYNPFVYPFTIRLQSTVVLQSVYQRQGGKEKIERETGWERERERYN